jgi:hypothetical protein
MGDLRTFIGAFFLIIGALLTAIPEARAPLTANPVNLYAGMSMLAFGAIMLWMGLRARRHP